MLRHARRLVPLGLAAVLGMLTAPPSAQAEPSENRFFGRAALGPGFASLDRDGGELGMRVDGLALFWDLALGATVVDQLALHVTYFGGMAPNPDVEVRTSNLDSDDTTLRNVGAGLGATYHFRPINAFLSFSAGFGWSVLQVANHPDTSWGTLGFASEVVGGYEFWVDRVRGLAVGLGAQAVYTRVTDEGGMAASIDYDSFGGSVLGTVTFR